FSGLACRRGIAAGRIAHLFQVPLHLGRYAGKVVELLVRNPAEMDFPERERSGEELWVIHGDGQRQIVLAVPVKPFLDVRIDAMGLAALARRRLRSESVG